jgi:hypothetical protein
VCLKLTARVKATAARASLSIRKRVKEKRTKPKATQLNWK